MEAPDHELDAWLARAAADRDEGAFEQLVRRHSAALYARALRATGSRELAEEVVQDAWLSAWLHLPGFHGRSSLRTWLTRIVYTTALNALRRPRPTVPLDSVAEPVDARDTESQAERNAEAAAVRASVSALPGRQRDAVVLRDLEGLSYEQVADALGCSVSSVKSALHRGRSALAEALVEHGPDVRSSAPGGRP